MCLSVATLINCGSSLSHPVLPLSSVKLFPSHCLSLSVSHRTVLSVLFALSATRVFFSMYEGAIATCLAGIVFIITQGS